MATAVVIPKMGMTMKEGTLVEWTVPDGSPVVRGDVLFHLVTDKLDTDVEAEHDGILRHGAEPGATLPAGAVVGWITVDGEAATQGSGPGSAAPRGATGVDGTVTEPGRGSDRVPASPVARKLAASLGIDLAAIVGTGPSGRITKEDVEAAAARTSTAAPSAAPAPGIPEPDGLHSRVPLVGMRQTIARRMHASLHEMAQLTLCTDVVMDDALELRRVLLDEWASDDVRPTVTDLVNRATVQALVAHPALNASVTEHAVERYRSVHLGIAVAVEDGLLVPVVRDAHLLSFPALVAASADLARRARSASINLDDLSGSTFTVSSLGASGITTFTPIVNPPNVGILGIGSVRAGVAWDGDVPRRRQQLSLSLTIDHRALDGAAGAAFLATVRERLEQPLRLLL